MNSPTLLSRQGSDRATAYVTSNKIVRHGGRLYVGWLDAPSAPGRLAPIRLGCCDAETGAMNGVMTLGYGYDNHCGPALVADAGGRFHAILGAHHHPFIYRWSDTPEDEASWSDPIALGPFDTYPSLTVDSEGTLHLVHRKMEDRWELWYRRKRAGAEWEPWVILTRSPMPGYIHFYQSLSIGPDGSLHLLVLFNYTMTGLSKDSKGRLVIHLLSDNGGTTWYHEGRRCELPLAMGALCPVLHFPEGGLSVSNHVVDERGRLWFFAITPGEERAQLLRRDEGGWRRIALPEAFRRLNFSSSRESSISRDALGTIHLVTGTRGDEAPSSWYDPHHDLFHLAIAPDGSRSQMTQLTRSGSDEACWLPSLENWSWSGSRPDNRVGLAFTQGANGGPGGNRNGRPTRVALMPACPDLPPL